MYTNREPYSRINSNGFSLKMFVKIQLEYTLWIEIFYLNFNKNETDDLNFIK
jgi:hypothetical protein